jgi:hypothetical protein
MTPLYERPELSSIPILLSGPQIDHPYEVLEEFFGDFSLGEIRKALQTELIVCLTTENAAFAKPEERSGLLQCHDRVAEVLEAAFLIVRQKRSDGVYIVS